MGYYSALIKKKLLSYTATWMNPRDTMLSEISRAKRDKHHTISF
jgi:hypothetical protein